MKSQFDIHQLIREGLIKDELELEKAMIADRVLRHLVKENPELKIIRKKLRDLIEQYEDKHWSDDAKFSPEKIKESEIAETIAENERQFIKTRKELITKKLKALNMTQQQLGIVLGHNSKSYMSELVNGVCPFSLRDLVVIHRLLNIRLSDLIPTVLSHNDRISIKTSIHLLGNTKLKL